MEANAVVPLWPSLGADGNVSRRMCFLFGEARWYLWMQDANKQAIAALRRDLLLLHQNGDLELVKEPSSGSYVTALHDGKMVRGRVLAPKDKLDSSNNIRNTVSLIDLDEGQTYVVATNQIRLLPPELTSLPCQAVRCDIGLDCIEQFTWPPELNSMLQRALEKAYLFVTNTSSRPGSIPTILAEIVIFNPSTGQSMTIQNWLLNFFSPHLDLCSLDKYIPFPVGMTPELMEKALEFQQQQVLGFQVQGSGAFSPMTPNGPQGIHGGSPGNALSEGIPSPSTVFTGPNSLSTKKTPSMSSSMPTHMPMPPLSGLNSSPCIMPNRMPIGMQPATYGGLHGMPSNIPPSLPNIMPTGVPSGANSMPVGMRLSVPNCMAPNVNPSMQNCVPTGMHSSMAESFPFVQQRNIHNVGPGGYSRNVTPSYHHGPQPHFNSPQHFCGVPLTNTMPHHGFMQTRSPSPVPSFSVSFPSQMLSSTPTLPSLTKQKLSGASSCSPQASSSSSSSVSSVGAPDPLPVKSGLLTKTNENEGPMIPSNITNLSNSEFLKQCQPQSSGTTLQLIREKECDSPPDSSGSLEQENNGTQTTTATSGTVSNLNINAPPFDGSLRKVRGNGPTSSSGLSADAPLFVPLECSTGTAAKEDMNIQTESNSKKVSPIDDEGTVSTSNFKTGKEVTLLQIVRDWKRGQVLQAFMARVWNPSCFEVNVVDQYSGLLSRIQGEMTDYYVSHSKKILSKTEGKELCGNYCACFDADENFWFRAEVDNWFMDDSVTPLKVWAVDYGGFSRVDISHIQPLVTELACTSPILVTICSMMNIQPCSNNGIWPEIHLNRVKELLPEDNSLYIRVDGSMSIDHIWPVSVFTDSECLQSINEILVAEGCASYIGSKLIDSLSGEQYEDADNPMEEAYKIGGNNYDIDDEDACVAVSGRKPTEEIGICWFYNSHGYCYKKFCSKKHVRLDPDGHSIEKVGMFTRSYEELDESFLTSGKTIKLTVTRILTVNHFIARVHAGKGTPGIKSRETLSSVIKHLNSKDMRRSLKTFTEFPADGEVVLFKDKSGTFFRGRVLCADSNDENLYEVLNVDSGYLQMVPLHDLRRVDPAFLHHPFQAVECWLADVAPIENDPECVKTSNEIFADLVRGQRMVATVIRSSPWGIEVNMCDKDHRDIAIALLEMNLVTKSPMRHLPVSDSHQIPG